jgi:Uncharacterized protein conserved in bacteria
MSNGRHIGLDLLRILAAFGVVLIHTSSPLVIGNMKHINETFWAANFYDSLGRFSVPIFVIISGFFILRPVVSLRDFYRRRFSRIAWPFLIWSIVYFLWAIFFDKTSWSKIGDSLMWGKSYFHLWFLGMLMGLYAIAPFLGDLKQRVSSKTFSYITVVALLMGMALNKWTDYTHSKLWISVLWVPFVGYFMVGSTIARFKGWYASKWFSLVVFLVSFESIFLLTGYLFGKHRYEWYFYDYLCIFTILGSVALVNIFMRLKIFSSPLISKLSELTFGIYLIHIIPLGIYNRLIPNFLDGFPFLKVFFEAIVVFIVSSITIWGMSKIKWIKKVMI